MPRFGPGHAREEASVWALPDLDGLEVLEARYKTQAFAPHVHETFSIGVIEQGACRFRYRSAFHRAPAGSVVLINAGEVHDGQPDSPDGLRYRMLYPSLALMGRAWKEAGSGTGAPFFGPAVVHDAAAARAVARLHLTLERSPDALERESVLLQTLVALATRHGDLRRGLPVPTDAPPALGRARDYLDAYFTRNVSLRELAAVAGLSPFHLLRSFRRAFGITPHAYVAHRRLERARALLRQGTSLANAALDAGFVDQSHLTNRFKKVAGITPGRYARGRNILETGASRAPVRASGPALPAAPRPWLRPK